MKIFVTKLNPNTNDQGLMMLFSQFGQVESTKVIMDRDTGKSKCFGFVEMSNDAEAKEAIEGLNSTEFEGNLIVVIEAQDKGDRKPQQRFDGNRNNRPNNNFRNNQDRPRRFDNNNSGGGFDRNSGGYDRNNNNRDRGFDNRDNNRRDNNSRFDKKSGGRDSYGRNDDDWKNKNKGFRGAPKKDGKFKQDWDEEGFDTSRW
ncbi:MAG: RNA-binding protein [Flavobacteriales bacterium]|nr:RNA-binding protein [Flavobacteriales bacterium]